VVVVPLVYGDEAAGALYFTTAAACEPLAIQGVLLVGWGQRASGACRKLARA
jgi:hypothetical protein